MPKEREPYSWAYDVKDDDFGDDLAHEDLLERDAFGFEEFGCCFPERCCTPGPHSEGECVSVETMEDFYAEAELEAEASGELAPVDRPTPDPEEGPF